MERWREVFGNRSPKKPERDALLKQLRNLTVRSPERGVRFSLKTHENHVVRPAGIEPATLSLEGRPARRLRGTHSYWCNEFALESVRSMALSLCG